MLTKTSPGAPPESYCANYCVPAKLNSTLIFGFFASKALPISVKDLVRNATTITLKVMVFRDGRLRLPFYFLPTPSRLTGRLRLAK